ncbi:FYVE and coiled-coil domain-containing protein 1 isoform X2 [Electrophorus electricus]|uniref:FYVE and coiled-coil domain-containing protein 1 isoform X2 n=1 Tax=Electrophorus electricus TaxID=8005 RepID=UPI0015CFF822|nr:FYVE and coiled-coil domain-containing protein 1 isoform X2 [Electrophorus electricus]
MASVTVGENQLQRIIRDLHDAVAELGKEHMENGEPITDDSANLHKFCYKLEYLLQYDQKEKATFLGSRKDYWDYFCDCLAKMKGTNDGIRFVKSISELKTSLGKGRAFIRYCLVHQRLADTLQQCLMNQRVTCDWYYARSPFLKSYFNVDIINHLYELNEVQFDVASRGYDLDSEWPTFARRTLGSATHMWRPPSRCSSVNSLPAEEFLPCPDFGSNLLSDLGELGEISCSGVDELRAELDRSELQQQNLLKEVHRLTDEAAELRREVRDLQGKLLVAENVNQKPHNERDQLFDSSQKQEAEQANGELTGSLQPMTKEPVALKENEERLAELQAGLEKERTATLRQTNELQAAVNHLEEALRLKEQEARSLQIQLQDMQKSIEEEKNQVEEMKKREQEGHEELHQRNSQILSLQEQLKLKETELSFGNLKIQQLENQSQRLSEHNQSMENQGKKLEEYKTQCSSLMEINAKLLHTIKRAEESSKELAESKAALERELTILKASETFHARLDSAGLIAEEQEKKPLEENQHLEESIQKAQMKSEAGEVEVKILEKSELQVAVKEKHGELYVRPSSMDTETGADRHLKADLDKERANKNEDLYASQLDLNMKEVSRLQGEVMDLQALLQVSAEERLKIQAMQEVTEASREDLHSQSEQLKAQVEELNQQHVAELLQCREREEAIAKERDSEAHARADIQAQVASIQKELDMLKRQHSSVALQNAEAREALHTANIEMAELGIQVCLLTRHNEELVAKLQELEKKAQKEVQALNDCAESLSKDNTRLLEELYQVEELHKAMKELQQRLEEAQEEARTLRKCNQREINALRVQLAEQATHHGDKEKVLNEDLLGAQSQMEAEQEKVATLETRLAELEAINRTYCQMIEEKNTSIASCDGLLLQKEEQLNQMKEDLSKAQEKFALAQKACQDLSENLQKITSEKQTCDLKASAEIDDLYRTKRNLEERLVELIRDKDVLWQKSDALEFEQKLRAEEETERDLPYCLGCHTQFTWWLRRHNCKLCGRPFCHSCCNNTVIVHQGGNRERCCKDCYDQHSAIAEGPPQEDLGGPSQPRLYPSASTPTKHSMLSDAALQSPRLDDMAFDIITDEEVNGILDNDSLLFTTALCPESGAQGPEELGIAKASTSNLTAEEVEELPALVQDTELCLITSGEMTLSVPLTMEEIAEFGEESRELFIKSGCYSRLPITVADTGPTICWEFSSTPKSISLCVVYRESAETPLEQTKVLIPLTRCSSHKETIRGKLKACNPGEYSLIFDNSYSRFISKKVFYRLSMEQPVV